MIRSLSSPTLASFKTLVFRPGLNILLADRNSKADDHDTRNGAGKTSFVELVHFLLGSDIKGKRVELANPALESQEFRLDLEVRGAELTVDRSASPRTRGTLRVARGGQGTLSYKNPEWKHELGRLIFGLPDEEAPGFPTFRSLFPYFARRDRDGGFANFEQHTLKQSRGDWQTGLSWLLGLNWRVPAELGVLREQEAAIVALRKAAKAGALGAVVGKASDLKTQLTVEEGKRDRLRRTTESFLVNEQYREMEKEVADLSTQYQKMSDESFIDEQALNEIRLALTVEAPPAPEALPRMFEEVKVVLPEHVKKRFEEVQAFHESVVRNRKAYLEAEFARVEARLLERRSRASEIDQRRSQLFAVLRATGALEEFTGLQQELARSEQRVESLRLRHRAAEQIEGKKAQAASERARLFLRLQQDIKEQDGAVTAAIREFADVSRELWNFPAELTIEPTPNGLEFEVKQHAGASAGIGKMKTFCFDMMLARLCSRRGIGPGFLVHDSHLFDATDERQISHALWVGHKTAKEFGLQYIVTLNSDRLPPSFHAGFNPRDYVLPVELSDAKEDGGLFGFRFA